jgi:hypothetical protein
MKKLLVSLILLSLGCSSFSLTSPSQDTLAGTWNLTEVNDKPLPFVFAATSSNKVELVKDVLTITAPDKFSEVSTMRNTRGSEVSSETILDSGTYEFNSYVVTFHFQSDGSMGAGTLTGRTMKVVTSGISFTYEKQK